MGKTEQLGPYLGPAQGRQSAPRTAKSCEKKQSRWGMDLWGERRGVVVAVGIGIAAVGIGIAVVHCRPDQAFGRKAKD